MPRGLWRCRGLEWLQAAELNTKLDELQGDVLAERFRSLTAMVERVEEELNCVASRHPGVELLKTIHDVKFREGNEFSASYDERRAPSAG